MPRTIPILIILGLAIYSFFDVLQTDEGRIRRYPKTFWLVMVLVPVAGAALWFLSGRPRRSRSRYGPPRVITLKPDSARSAAPDDDPAFLKRLEEEAWRQRRAQRQAGQQAQPPVTPQPPEADDPPQHDGPAPGGPGVAPA